jgi:hypothetical protein
MAIAARRWAVPGLLVLVAMGAVWQAGPAQAATITVRSDSATVSAGSFVDTDVRANDTTTAGPLHRPTVLTAPAHGTATVNAAGTIRYHPAAHFSGAAWQKSVDGGRTWVGYADPSGVATLSFTARTAQSGYLYRVVFSNLVGQTASVAVRLTVRPTPIVKAASRHPAPTAAAPRAAAASPATNAPTLPLAATGVRAFELIALAVVLLALGALVALAGVPRRRDSRA